MKNCKKIISALLCAVLTLGMLVGCGDDKTTVNKDSDSDGFKSLYGDQTAEERLLFEKRDVKDVDIELFWFQSSLRDDIRDAIEMYKDLYGGNVDVYYSGWNERATDLALLNTAGEVPDVLLGFLEYDFPKFIDMGIFGEITADEFDFSSKYVDKNAIDSILTRDGKIYGIAVKDDPEVIIYNKKYIKDMGFETPYELYKSGKWDWNAFRTLAKNMTYDSDNDGIFDHVGFRAWSLRALMVSNNTWPLVKKDGKVALNLDSSEMRAMYQLVYDMANVDKSLGSGDETEGFEKIASGHVTMYLERPLRIVNIINAGAKAEDIEIAPVPKGDAASDYLSFYSPVTSAISSSCKNKEAALALIECYMSVQNKMTETGPRECYGYNYTEQQQEVIEFVRNRESVELVPTGYGQIHSYLNAIYEEIKDGSTVAAAIELYKNKMNNDISLG